MEPATMSDVKVLMKELRESIRETVAEAFGNSKPALEHATTSNASQLLTMDASDAKVPTPACSSPDQGTSAFDPSPTATIDILSELDVDTTGVAAPALTTCSTDGLNQNADGDDHMAAWHAAWSVPTSFTKPLEVSPTESCQLSADLEPDNLAPTECSMKCFVQTPCALIPVSMPEVSQSVKKQGQVLRPLPWPSFRVDHVVGHEIRPKSWPPFYCFHDGAHRKHTWPLPQVTYVMKHFYGDLTSLRESLRYLQRVQLKLCTDERVACWISQSPRAISVPSQQLGVFAIHLTDGISLSSRHYTTGIGDTWYGSGSYSTDNMMIGGKEVLITRLLANMFCCNRTKSETSAVCKFFCRSAQFHWKVAGLFYFYHLSTCRLVTQLRLLVSANYFTLMYAVVKNQRNYMQNLHLLKLTCVLEQEVLICGFQFYWYMAIYLVHGSFFLAAPTIWPCIPVLSLSNILGEWHFQNQSIKYNSLTDTFKSGLLCVRSVCATVDAVVLPDGQRSRNWHSAQPAIARDALLFIIQSIVLNYMDYWWVTTVILTDIVSIVSARLPVQMEVTCSVQTKLLLARAYQLNSSGRERMVLLSHKGRVMVPRPIPVYDPMLEWRISMHSQCLLIGVMNMGYESMLALTKFSFAGNKLTCFSNSETPRCELLVASLELMWFCVTLVGGKGTFQGGRHMLESFISTQVTPIVMRPWWCSCSYLDHDSYITFLGYVDSDGLKVPQVPWDPGVYVIAITIFEQLPTGHKYYLDSDDVRASDSDHLGPFFDWVSIGHIFYFCLAAVYPNSGYYHHTDSIKLYRLQWDPGGFSMMSAWGQAEFQGGRGVSNPSYTSTWAGTWASGAEHGPGHTGSATTNIQGDATRGDYPGWITANGMTAAPSPPTPGSLPDPLSCLFIYQILVITVFE